MTATTLQTSTPETRAFGVTPILRVEDFAETVDYYTTRLLFSIKWDWGSPKTFGCVSLDAAEIFLCLRDQGSSGTWLSLFVDDVDAYHREVTERGANVIHGPCDEPWGCREFHVRDPNGHIIRFGQGIPATEPKIEIERAPVKATVEKPLLALAEDLAANKRMSLGQMFEEILLHSFEPVAGGGSASPHSRATLRYVQELRKKHGIDYDTHANYRFVDKSNVDRGDQGKP